jgi:flavin reductase (DIM6/NTAB) family NADH-FMN oxidoreductase RutF
MAFDSKSFRAALGSFPTGIAVITALGPESHIGITVNSFTCRHGWRARASIISTE